MSNEGKPERRWMVRRWYRGEVLWFTGFEDGDHCWHYHFQNEALRMSETYARQVMKLPGQLEMVEDL